MTELVWGSERGAEVYFIFRQEADVANLQRVLAVSLAKSVQDIQRLASHRRSYEVRHFFRIGCQIVELFGRTRFPERTLGGVQLSFVKQLFPHLGRLRLKHVIHMLPPG